MTDFARGIASAKAGRGLAPRHSLPRVPCVFIGAVIVSLIGTGCVTRDQPTDTDQTVNTTPTGTTNTVPVTTPPTTTSATVAYTTDMAPIFSADCLRCHSGSRPDGNYSMATYEQVLKKVVVGNARSALVTSTQSRGSMYRYWSGNAAAKAELVRSWVVDNSAARTR